MSVKSVVLWLPVGPIQPLEYKVGQANRFYENFGVRRIYILLPNQSFERLHKHIASVQIVVEFCSMIPFSIDG
jgi:hypothetical protein